MRADITRSDMGLYDINEFLTAFERTRPTPCLRMPSDLPQLMIIAPLLKISTSVPGQCVFVSSNTSTLYCDITVASSCSFADVDVKDKTFQVPIVKGFFTELNGF